MPGENRRLTVLSALPFVMMSGVALVDVAAGPGVGFLPLLSLGPAFASLVGGWRRTAGIGVVALVLCVALGLYNGLFEVRRGYMTTASVAGVTAAGIAAAVMRQRREAELASVRSIAEAAQRVLLKPGAARGGPSPGSGVLHVRGRRRPDRRRSVRSCRLTPRGAGCRGRCPGQGT